MDLKKADYLQYQDKCEYDMIHERTSKSQMNSNKSNKLEDSADKDFSRKLTRYNSYNDLTSNVLSK